MNRKFSIVFAVLLTIMMSATIFIYGKEGEDRSKENMFATKYNHAFALVNEVKNFDQEEGSAGIEGKISSAYKAIADLEKYIANNNIIEKDIIANDIKVWRDELSLEVHDIYTKAISTLQEIQGLNINDKTERELMQDKINIGTQYINTVYSLQEDKEDAKSIELLEIKENYIGYQDSLEKLLYDALEIAREEITQQNIDALMVIIPENFPADLKNWYTDMAVELQNGLMNKVLKEISKLYAEVNENVDSATTESHKEQIEGMLTQFANSSNNDVVQWAANLQNLIDNMK